MEIAIISLIILSLFLTGTMVVVDGGLLAIDTTSSSWLLAEERMGEARRTEIEIVGISVAGGFVDITVSNDGGVSLAKFSKWDLVVRYLGTDDKIYIKHLTYTSGVPGNDEWTMTGIFLDAGASDPEVYEPGILNPQEEAVFRMKLQPNVKIGSTNRVDVITPNGVAAEATFTG